MKGGMSKKVSAAVAPNSNIRLIPAEHAFNQATIEPAVRDTGHGTRIPNCQVSFIRRNQWRFSFCLYKLWRGE